MRAKALTYKILLIVLMLACANLATAREGTRTINFGVEWDYIATMAQFRNYYYQNSEGTKINDDSGGFSYKSNGAILGKVSARLGKLTSLSLYAGYCGIYEGRGVFPVSLRCSVYPKGIDNNSFMLFLDGGAGFTNKSFQNKPTLMGKLGWGYHFPLNTNYSIDLLMAVQAAYDHPNEVLDRFAGEFVRDSYIFRSDVLDLGVHFGIGINF